MRLQLRTIVGFVAGGSLMSATVSAAEINVPGDFASIQDAINAAVNGDEICVAPGTYNETIDFLGKAIAVYGSEGPQVTTIDGTGLNDIVVRCVSGEGLDTILEGFTITGGGGFGFSGGGMYNLNSSPTISDCIFHQNSGSDGVGMLNVNSNPWIEDCTFSENSVIFGIALHGAGMYNGNASNPTVIACLFIGNVVSGGSNANRGGGMFNAGGSNPLVIECTFAGNSASGPGVNEGGAMWSSADSLPTVEDSFFCENTPDHIFGPFDDTGDNVFAQQCDIDDDDDDHDDDE